MLFVRVTICDVSGTPAHESLVEIAKGGRMTRILRYFFQGLIILLPVGGTMFAVYSFFHWLDVTVAQRFPWLTFPGAGILGTFVFITVIGFLGSMFLFRTLVAWTDLVFRKLPFVKILYNALRDLISAFVGDKKSFDQPVVVTLIPGSNVKVIGFLTRKDLDFLGLADHVCVYLPQSYNFAGNVLILPLEQVKPLAADSSTALAFLVSGGVSIAK